MKKFLHLTETEKEDWKKQREVEEKHLIYEKKSFFLEIETARERERLMMKKERKFVYST